MTVALTVTDSTVLGNYRRISGTFTSAAKDTAVTLSNSTHGLNYIADYSVNLYAVGAQAPKFSVSGGTLTATYDDLQGYSGDWSVMGR